jgi:fatty-acyl-CoA synthase
VTATTPSFPPPHGGGQRHAGRIHRSRERLHFLAEAAARWPDRRGLRQGDREVDHATAERLARQLASALHERGVQPGDRVGCLMHNELDHLLAYFGVAAAGAILVSLNTRLSPGEQQNILRTAAPRCCCTMPPTRRAPTELAGPLPGGTLLVARAIADGRADDATLPLAAADDAAHLYYTSGTTGAPKGVVLTHRNVCTHALAAVQELGLAATDTWAHIAPMFHLADAWATFAITAVGGTHVFLPHFTPESAHSTCSRTNASRSPTWCRPCST